MELEGISDKVSGTWSLWRVSLQSESGAEHRFLALFLTDEGRVLLPTARAVWDRLVSVDADAAKLDLKRVSGASALEVYEQLRLQAETQGQRIFDAMESAHRARLDRERTKGEHAFAARRKVIDRLGLSAVRAFRLRQLEEDRRAWDDELFRRSRALPDLTALLVVRIEREGGLS